MFPAPRDPGSGRPRPPSAPAHQGRPDLVQHR